MHNVEVEAATMARTWNIDNDDASPIMTVDKRPSRTDSEDTLVEQIPSPDLLFQQTRTSKVHGKSACRDLVASNAELARPTPTIRLHTSRCTCSFEANPQLSSQDLAEDLALAEEISSSASLLLAKGLLPQPTQFSPKLTTITAFASVTRWITGVPPPSESLIGNFSFAVAAVDITKITHLLTQNPGNSASLINTRNAAGVPPLIVAIRSHLRTTRPRSQRALIAFLLDAGADVHAVTGPVPNGWSNFRGVMSALSSASVLGLNPVVELLLARGADVDAAGTNIPMYRFEGHRMTALHVAVFAGHAATADVLLRCGGADVAAAFDVDKGSSMSAYKPETGGAGRKDRWRWTTGMTALHLADDGPSCATVLLRHGADPEARDGAGRTPLHWAVVAGNVGVARLLLEAGSPADVMDDDGGTPLAQVVAMLECGKPREGYPDIVSMLLAAGANPGLRYPQDLSVRARMMLMDEWKAVYEGIFAKFEVGNPGARQVVRS